MAEMSSMTKAASKATCGCESTWQRANGTFLLDLRVLHWYIGTLFGRTGKCIAAAAATVLSQSAADR
jgi:hypothetical protein